MILFAKRGRLIPKFQNPSGPIYKGRSIPCVGEGCSNMTSNALKFISGASEDQLGREDAWYMRAQNLKRGGEEVYNSTSGDIKDFLSKFKAGDIVMLDDPDRNERKNKPSDVPGNTLEDNYGNEHVGFMLPNGLVWHGTGKGKYRIDPIDDVRIPNLGFSYKPISVVRNKDLDRQKINEFFNVPDVVKSELKLDKEDANKIEKDYTKALSNNLNRYAIDFDLDENEVVNLAKAANGVLGQESSDGGNLFQKTFRKSKQAIAKTIEAFGGDQASKGLTRIKDGIFENADGSPTLAGKYKTAYQIDNLEIPEHAANATMLNLIQNYKKLKDENPDESFDERLYKTVGSYNVGAYGKVPYADDHTNMYVNQVLSKSDDVKYEGDVKAKGREDYKEKPKAKKNKVAGVMRKQGGVLFAKKGEKLGGRYIEWPVGPQKHGERAKAGSAMNKAARLTKKNRRKISPLGGRPSLAAGGVLKGQGGFSTPSVAYRDAMKERGKTKSTKESMDEVGVTKENFDKVAEFATYGRMIPHPLAQAVGWGASAYNAYGDTKKGDYFGAAMEIAPLPKISKYGMKRYPGLKGFKQDLLESNLFKGVAGSTMLYDIQDTYNDAIKGKDSKEEFKKDKTKRKTSTKRNYGSNKRKKGGSLMIKNKCK